MSRHPLLATCSHHALFRIGTISRQFTRLSVQHCHRNDAEIREPFSSRCVCARWFIEQRRADTSSQKKRDESRARRVCHWPQVESKILLSLGGCEPHEAELARRGHCDLSLSFLFCDFSSPSFLAYTSLWRSTRGSWYLEKPWGRVLGKIWERPGTTFLVSSWRSLVRINDLSQRF